MAAETKEKPGAFERFLFRRVPVWLLLIVALLGLAATILFGMFVLHAAQGGSRLKWLQQPALLIANAPSLLSNLPSATRDPFRSPPGTPPGRAGLSRSGFVDDGYLLIPAYDPRLRRPLVRLIRLADGEVLREFMPDVERLESEAERRSTPATDERGVPVWMGHPDLLEDGSIIFKGNHLLVRVDACGAIQWIRHGHHHSVERGPDGEFWTAMVHPRPERSGVTERYRADSIARVNLDGELTYARSLDRIFAENGLDAMIRGSEYSDDPYHLNDVQPVFADGRVWRRGDLFLSLAHQSMVLLYRPSTGRVVWWRIGPWLGQHDVNVLDRERISIFDNRISFDAARPRVLGTSRELVVDFSNGTISSPWEVAFRSLGLSAPNNGRGLVLANDDLVIEESNGGEVLRVSPEGAVRWHYVNADDRGRRYRLFWSRYLDPARYEQAVQAASAARCPGR